LGFQGIGSDLLDKGQTTMFLYHYQTDTHNSPCTVYNALHKIYKYVHQLVLGEEKHILDENLRLKVQNKQVVQRRKSVLLCSKQNTKSMQSIGLGWHF
jgi:hypothetical protein